MIGATDLHGNVNDGIPLLGANAIDERSGASTRPSSATRDPRFPPVYGGQTITIAPAG